METFEEFMAAMKALREENEKGFAELREQQKESAKEWAEYREQQKEREKESAKERAKEWAELREQQKERDRELTRIEKLHEESKKKSEEEWEDLRKCIKETRKDLGGISKKNGKMAEDYFYNSLEKSKTLGGVHFDAVKRNIKGTIPLGDGKTLDGEYDITLINDNSLGIVEVKYTVEKSDVENLAEEQVKNFKMLFPMYANYRFYLGIGGLSFDRQAEDTAKKMGIGILKLNGDAVEIQDKNLKVY